MGGNVVSCCEKRDKDEPGGPVPPPPQLLSPTGSVGGGDDAKSSFAIRSSPQHVNDIDLEHFTHTFISQPSKGHFEDTYTTHEGHKHSQLGVGASGAVHIGVHNHSKTKVAVKTIDRKALDKSAAVALRTEVDIMSILDHPHIIKLFEYFEDETKTILVMELCTGGELFDKIVSTSSSGGVCERHAAFYFRQILLAVVYLHKHNIVHRDIKPENFLMQDREDETNVKLIDFGIAAKTKPGGKLKDKIGTADYLAPEVMRGKDGYGAKVDIWSCGVVLFTMLTATPLFARPERVVENLKENFAITYPKNPCVSKQAQDLIRTMLTVDQEKRPTAQDLLKHAWLDANAPRHSVELDPDTIKRFRSFGSSRKLKQICKTYIATQLNEGEVAQLRKLFESLDEDGDGSLSREELAKGMQDLNMKPEDIEAIMGLDSDGSGEIDWTEFVAAAMDFQDVRKKDVIDNAFRKFDLDGDGQITKAELASVLASGDSEVSEETIQQLMEEADTDGDGSISMAEFERMICD